MLGILRLTLKEVIRRRILLVTVLLAVIFLALYGLGVHFIYSNNSGPDSSTVKAMLPAQLFALGLFFGSFIVSFLSVMVAVGSVSSEIENGIIYAVVPRPIRRSSIILGKLLGYTTLLIIFSAIFYLSIIGIVSSSTGIHVPFNLEALVLYSLQPLILLSVTMLGTTILPTLANGIAAFSLYALSVLGGMLEQIGYIINNNKLINTGILASLLIPSDAIYRKIVYILSATPGTNFSTLLMGPFGASVEPSIWMLVYTGIYILVLLGLAVRIFSRRDI